MTRYALLLRGVNVGKGNSLPMAALREMLEAAGCTGVRTYVQSGNAVLETGRAPEDLTAEVERALERFMGRPVATTLRTPAELRALVDRRPLADVATSPRFLCATFLAQPPSPAALAPLHARSWEPERFEALGREIVTWHPDGQARSPLAAALAGLPLRGAVTTRNWNTVTKLLAMLEEA